MGRTSRTVLGAGHLSGDRDGAAVSEAGRGCVGQLHRVGCSSSAGRTVGPTLAVGLTDFLPCLVLVVVTVWLPPTEKSSEVTEASGPPGHRGDRRNVHRICSAYGAAVGANVPGKGQRLSDRRDAIGPHLGLDRAALKQVDVHGRRLVDRGRAEHRLNAGVPRPDLRSTRTGRRNRAGGRGDRADRTDRSRGEVVGDAGRNVDGQLGQRGGNPPSESVTPALMVSTPGPPPFPASDGDAVNTSAASAEAGATSS